jgi:hypothetical protein
VEAPLSPFKVAQYDAAVALWQNLRSKLEAALQLAGIEKRDVWKTYWAAQQRFFKLLCVGLKLDTVITEVRLLRCAGGLCLTRFDLRPLRAKRSKGQQARYSTQLWRVHCLSHQLSYTDDSNACPLLQAKAALASGMCVLINLQPADKRVHHLLFNLTLVCALLEPLAVLHR